MPAKALRWSLRRLLRQLGPFCKGHVSTVTIHVQSEPWIAVVALLDGQRLRFPLYPATKTGKHSKLDTEDMSLLQRKILESLDGKALRTGALAKACECEERRLFRPTGLPPLRDRGLVLNHPELGFYRTDALPPELRQ